MAALPEADRWDVWASWMRENLEATGFTKSEMRAAVNAVDDYMEANAGSINSALPTPFRTGASTAQKARLLMLVVARRFLPEA